MGRTMRWTIAGVVSHGPLPGVAAALVLATGAAAQLDPLGLTPPAHPAAAESAEPAPIDLDSLDGLLTALGSDQYRLRELASAALSQPGAPTDEQLVSLAQRDDISAEQRARLLGALRDRFENRPPGQLAAVGIQMEENTAGIRVARLFDDFPAATVLKQDDVIMEIDGHDLSNVRTGEKSRMLMSIIIEQTPGRSAPMTIVRDGRRMSVDVPFGARADFPDRNNATADVMERAWTIRAERLGILDPDCPVIAADVRPADWLRNSRPLGRLAGDRLAAGGAPVDDEVIAVTDASGRLTAQNMKDPIAIQGNGLAGRGVAPNEQRQQSRLITMQTLGTELMRLRDRMTDLRAALQEPGLTADRRALIQEQLLVCEQMDLDLRARLEQLRDR